MVINIKWSEEDQEFVATTPDFPFISGLGETKEKAIEELKIAIELARQVICFHG